MPVSALAGDVALGIRRVSVGSELCSSAIWGLGDGAGRVGIERRATCHQVLVVQERPAESALEEVVAQHELLRQLPQAQVVGGVAVVAHDQGAGVSPRDELVVLAAVDLHLVLIEHMPEVARDHALRQGLALRAQQRKGRVGQVVHVGGGLVDLIGDVVGLLRRGHHAVPDGRQHRQRRAVAVDLGIVRRRQRGQGLFHAGEVGEEIVEAAVLGKDHDQGLDVLAQLRGQVRRRRGSRIGRRSRSGGSVIVVIIAGAAGERAHGGCAGAQRGDAGKEPATGGAYGRRRVRGFLGRFSSAFFFVRHLWTLSLRMTWRTVIASRDRRMTAGIVNGR